MKPLLLTMIRSFGRFWCRIHGATVSPSALIHGIPRITIKSDAKIILDSGCTLNCTPWSNPLNDGRESTLFAGPGATIRFAKDSGASSARIVAYQHVTIGEHSLIGAGSLICDSDMHEVPLGSGKPVQTAPITIGKHVFIGANSTILKGVTIGDGAVIGANSVVTSNVQAHTLVAGNPARIIRHV